jgi:hypothetical protein
MASSPPSSPSAFGKTLRANLSLPDTADQAEVVALQHAAGGTPPPELRRRAHRSKPSRSATSDHLHPPAPPVPGSPSIAPVRCKLVDKPIHRRARPCPFRQSGCRGRRRELRERISAQIRGSMRCKANCPCTAAGDAAPEPERGAAAGRQRPWATAEFAKAR